MFYLIENLLFFLWFPFHNKFAKNIRSMIFNEITNKLICNFSMAFHFILFWFDAISLLVARERKWTKDENKTKNWVKNGQKQICDGCMAAEMLLCHQKYSALGERVTSVLHIAIIFDRFVRCIMSINGYNWCQNCTKTSCQKFMNRS